jgi:hypothetical protein
MWWMIAFSVVGGLAVLFLFGARNERAVRRDWELLLTPKGKSLYRDIEGKVHSEMALANLTYEEAFSVKALGSMDEAIRLLDVGYRVIEKFAPSMLKLLSAMATFSRMVSAMAPVTPLRPKDFRLTQLVSLAYLNGLLHQFLVSTAERYRLRLYILGRSFGIATRFLLDSTQRIVRREPAADREWEQIETIRQDFQTLTEESLESLRVLLTSLAAERRDDVLRLPEP